MISVGVKTPLPHPPIDNNRYILIIINMYTEQRFYVTTSDAARLRLWDRLFHSDRLPVRSARPSLTPGLCLAYRLDAAALNRNQVNALIGWLVWWKRMRSEEAAALVREGFPIEAAGVELVQEQGQGNRHSASVSFIGKGKRGGYFRSFV